MCNSKRALEQIGEQLGERGNDENDFIHVEVVKRPNHTLKNLKARITVSITRVDHRTEVYST